MKKEQFIYGIHPLLEAIRSGKEIDKVLIQIGLKGDNFGELKALLKEYAIPSQQVPIEKLNKITRQNHQGIIGFVSPISYQPIDEVIQQVFEKGESPFLLLLDRITDVRNFGAIARTAECAGVHALIVPSKGSALISEDAIKTSAGALFNIPVCREDNLKTTINFLKQSGLQVVGVTEKAQKNYTQVDFMSPTVLIMGSEEDGISPEYLKLCDDRVMIPMMGKIASLNVSVSAGVLMYEVVRQRASDKL